LWRRRNVLDRRAGIGAAAHIDVAAADVAANVRSTLPRGSDRDDSLGSRHKRHDHCESGHPRP